MDKAEGCWTLELWADCPRCERTAMYTDSVSSEGEKISDEFVTCRYCNHTFELSASEY